MTSDSVAPDFQNTNLTENNFTFDGFVINRLTQAAVETELIRCIMLFTQLLGNFGAVSTQGLWRP
jgi:hypothetical protein